MGDGYSMLKGKEEEYVWFEGVDGKRKGYEGMGEGVEKVGYKEL